MKRNPAREALTRAINSAIARGEPVIVEQPYWDKPCAAQGLTSYRLKGSYGWIMIGAKDNAGAMREAARSTDSPDPRKLEVWDSKLGKYVPAM